MSYLSAEKAESELAQSIRKACSIEETAPKQKHVRSKCAKSRDSSLENVCLTEINRMYCIHLGSSNLCHHLEYS
jgi:hypothetical protein